jgi:hypothetical protein
MATDLKTLRREVYSTPLDTRILMFDAVEKLTHADTLLLNDLMIDMFALRARGIIDMKLGATLTGTSVIETTPYCGPVLIPRPDHDNTGENTGTAVLYGCAPASDAYTELWTIYFTSDTAFTVTGSYSGSQGTGSTTTDFTSTNSDIVIPSDAWSGTPAAGDYFYIPVYKHVPEMVAISSLLTAGLILKSINANTSTEGAGIGTKFYNDAESLLDDIASGTSGLMGVNTLLNSSDLMISYEISHAGYDISNYQDDENARYINNTSAVYPFWQNWVR